MQTVLVVGDLLWDHDLVSHPVSQDGHHGAPPRTILRRRAGGAWFLADLVALACADRDVDVRALRRTRAAGRAYTLWSLFPRHQERPQEQVWRVERFLGCQPAARPGAEAAELESRDPDLLLIDDLILGFRSTPQLWPPALADGGRPGRIVLKTGAPLAEGPLWERLLANHADRLTVVLPAFALRARRAPISRALSWDATIEDTARELLEGLSAEDLGRCRRVVVSFGEAGAASFARERVETGRDGDEPRRVLGEALRLERFLYVPDELEGMWRAQRTGRTFGHGSLLAAAVARHELDAASYPLVGALRRGLEGARLAHEEGAGAGTKGTAAAFTGPPMKRLGALLDGRREPPGRSRYCAAFPHDLLAGPSMAARPATRSDLLTDLTGEGLEYVAAKAVEVVLRGADAALGPAPKARYGAYLTVDREEIERINALRGLILAYRADPRDRRPLSIAVFGPPGSGKSFAIQQLAGEIFEGKRDVLDLNLSQFRAGDTAALHAAFHQVRDAAVHGRLPLVFWDEFDSAGLVWLKEFLAPMQDAEFRAGSLAHPFGKAIFVFAGGTKPDFASFDRSRHPDAAVRDAFAEVKGPDFVSRLRGFVNVKGPNPALAEGPEAPRPWAERAARDPAHLIRRALLLRSLLERAWPHLVDPRSRRAAVAASVVRGFLRARDYLHGARSLEMIVQMSALADADFFGVAALPAPDLLRLHVSDDFLAEVRAGQLEEPIVEVLAGACHDAWCSERRAGGYVWGPRRDDRATPPTHPLLRPYGELDEAGKEGNRLTARLTHAKLHSVGLAVAPRRDGRGGRRELTPAEVERLARIEHDIWLRDRLLQGYEWSASSDDRLQLHRDVVPFDALPAEDRRLDEVIAQRIPGALWERGYRLVPRQEVPTAAETEAGATAGTEPLPAP
ncbi:MAG TPA: RyR domain-containing protein [Thermoanaerobaculia bacterium]|nr:RyR domain-containing protein [Thermoanaerobaculia bacterium]